jgi:hypothetical protein
MAASTRAAANGMDARRRRVGGSPRPGRFDGTDVTGPKRRHRAAHPAWITVGERLCASDRVLLGLV